jgi:hypothetical protein
MLETIPAKTDRQRLFQADAIKTLPKTETRPGLKVVKNLLFLL